MLEVFANYILAYRLPQSQKTQINCFFTKHSATAYSEKRRQFNWFLKWGRVPNPLSWRWKKWKRHSLNRGKAGGKTGLNAEMMQFLSPENRTLQNMMIGHLWEEEKIPPDSYQSIVVLLEKPGKPATEVGKYIGWVVWTWRLCVMGIVLHQFHANL